MGKLEIDSRVNIRRSKINNAIIGTIAIAGIFSVAAIAPNVVGAIVGSKYIRQRIYQAKSSLSRLVKAGYVRVETIKGKKYLRLTKKGEQYAALLGKGKLAIKKPKRWDGKWRILMFDIPEPRRRIRNHIRATLKSLGLYRLQDSVWVYPYDCEDLTTLLKADLRIGKDLLYVIADSIEFDVSLKKHFNIV